MASFRRVHGRKLLLASIGVATATYIGCEDQTSGNLIAYPCDQNPNCMQASSSSGGGEGGQAGAGGQGGAAGSGGQTSTGGMGGTGGAGGSQPDGGM